ncbi:serine hydrolase [Kribbella sp. NPDC023972]|uniref:serine hydrolase n=1 Tax=Kribbella sp. NPDC023972 TaxID=3154795 RepID=UPI0033D8DBD6
MAPWRVDRHKQVGTATTTLDGEAVGPAGGIRASIRDMARLTAALLDGSAPGTAALDPVANFSGRAARIGAAWITLEHDHRLVTWHNGGTGGFRTWLGLDRSARTAVVLMSATSTSVDHHGFNLLAQMTPAHDHQPDPREDH